MTLYRYRLKFNEQVFDLDFDPDDLPTTTNAPNVTVIAAPLVMAVETKQLFHGPTEFWIDTDDVGTSGNALGVLHRVVS